MLECGVPIVAANVGEMRLLLADEQHLLYEDGDVESLVLAIQGQLKERRGPDLRVPSWQEQAGLLLNQMESVLASRR
jgi:glycosyltransferase involved in cell wall biosynthesis